MEQTSSTVSVLLVEEDSYYGWQIGRFLQGIQDCSATTVTTLGEATEKFASHHPDVLLLAEGSSAEKSFEWFCAIQPESNPVCILISLNSDDTSVKGAYLQKGAWQCLAKSDQNYFTDFLIALKKALLVAIDRKLRIALTSDGQELNSWQGADEVFHAGDRVLHYSILSPIGKGGMGQVYKALDDRLGRIVAMKVLPPSANSKTARRRLHQEARAASALNHPNIVTIYAIEEFQGSDFIVMEFVEGESLAEMLQRGPLNLSDFVRVALQLADALSAAHPAGLIHRDIKPANIMITKSGNVKLLDFGLAKRVSSADPLRELTAPGVIVGTVTYMSPEQAKAEDLDHRTDIFSLGAVLYQAATGVLPFQGKSMLAIMHEVVVKDPSDPHVLNPNLPLEIGRLILRALAKNKQDRYASASELAADLRRIQPGQKPGSGIKERHNRRVGSVAVLPFSDSGTGLEYLSRGVTENLLNALASIPNLRVVPRSTVFRYSGKDLDAMEVGRALNVGVVVTGRVVEHSGVLNIQAELTDIEKQSQIWGDQFKRKTSDIFLVQEEIATEIARRLRPRLTGKQTGKITKRATENIAAYHAYLKGRHQLSKRTREAFSNAVRYFNDAVERDERYSLAFTGIADSFNLLASYGYEPPREVLPRGLDAAIKALEIDPSLGEAYASLGYSLLLGRRTELAQKALHRAIHLNPRYAPSYVWLGLLLNLNGRSDEAAPLLKKALKLEPLSVIANLNLGILYFAQKEYAKAIEQFLFTLETEPGHAATQFFLGLAYEARGSYKDAREIVEKCVASTADVRYLAAQSHVYANAGEIDVAQRVLSDLEQRAANTYVAPTDLAIGYLAFGQQAKALQLLEKANEDLSSWWIFLQIDPRFDPVRKTPELQTMMRKPVSLQLASTFERVNLDH